MVRKSGVHLDRAPLQVQLQCFPGGGVRHAGGGRASAASDVSRSGLPKSLDPGIRARPTNPRTAQEPCTPTPAARRDAYPAWLQTCNHHRGHTALKGQPPASRVHNLTGQHTLALSGGSASWPRRLPRTVVIGPALCP